VDFWEPFAGLENRPEKALFASDFRGQALTAFCATALEHLLPIFGCHACTESVTAAAFGTAWLESPFHDNLKNFVPVNYRTQRLLSRTLLVIDE
jgi:hypothetical protein